MSAFIVAADSRWVRETQARQNFDRYVVFALYLSGLAMIQKPIETIVPQIMQGIAIDTPDLAIDHAVSASLQFRAKVKNAAGMELSNKPAAKA
jgi:hypothetical protein